jgi:hypothetical protein
MQGAAAVLLHALCVLLLLHALCALLLLLRMLRSG